MEYKIVLCQPRKLGLFATFETLDELRHANTAYWQTASPAPRRPIAGVKSFVISVPATLRSDHLM